MRLHYNLLLDKLHAQLLRLGKASTRSVQKAVGAYTTSNTELAHEVFSDDLRINALTAEIEKEVHKIIALQQPVAQDLRLLFAVLHVSIDLERIADHAVSIAKITIEQKEYAEDSKTVMAKLAEMSSVAEVMIAEALLAYMERDAKKARKVALMDEQIDVLLEEAYQLTADRMQKKADLIPVGIHYINVANSLERIGDYVTNICERVVFLNTGQIVELN